MRKFIIPLFLVALNFLTVASFAQTVQGTIKKTATNTVTVYAKSTTAYNKQIGNINFAISIPDQTLSAGVNPTDVEIIKVINLTNVSLATTGITNPYIIGNRAYYQYILVQTNTSADQATNWPADTDNPVMSLTFPTESYFSAMQMNDLSFNGGGPTFGMTWFVQINEGIGDVTDYTTPFYGINAVNNGGSAEQTVPLDITVPVRFTGFSATKKDNSALLTWQITNEDANVASYEIERSINGVNFTKVTSVTPTLNGSTANTYNLTDNNLSSLHAGIVYYRIKQIDRDGNYIYTDIKSVRVSSNGIVIGVYPNPVKNSTSLSLDLTEDAAVYVNLTDVTGKEIKRLNFNATKGLNVKKIDMTSLASGSYLIKVQAGTEVKTLSIVKTN